MKLPGSGAADSLRVGLCDYVTFGSRLFRDLSGCSGSGAFAFWLLGITGSQFRNGALSIEYILSGGMALPYAGGLSEILAQTRRAFRFN